MYDEETNVFHKSYGDMLGVDSWSGAADTCKNDGAELLILRNRKMIELALRCESLYDIVFLIGMI